MAKRSTTVKLVISHTGKIARGVRVPLDQLYNLKTLNVTARMIDMALSNVLYELIDKSIPAKPLGRWEGKKKVRKCRGVPDVAVQTRVRTHRDIRKLGETLNCRPCATVHMFASNGTSAEQRASEVPYAGEANKAAAPPKSFFSLPAKEKKKCADNP